MFRDTSYLAICCNRASILPGAAAPHWRAALPTCLAVAVSWFAAVGPFTPAVPAQDRPERPSKSGPTAALQDLVQQLGDASSLVRDAAAAELLRQGPAAKDVLTEALTDPDREIRTRAGLILQRLQQDPPAAGNAGQAPAAGPTEDQRELVRRLGHLSFLVREEASQKLESLGPAAKAVLLEALNDPDLEVRRRVRWILERVMEQEFDARLAAFVADVEGKQQPDLPGWKRFQELVGHDRGARKLFAAMIRSDGSLLSAYERQSPLLPGLLAGRAAWLQSSVAGDGSSGQVVTPQAVAALLLISSDPTIKDHAQSLMQLYQLLNCQATKELIEAGEHSPLVGALLEKWVTAVSTAESPFGIMLALKYELKDAALQLATKLLDKPAASSSMLHYAMIAIGRFGGPEQSHLLTPLLANKTVCHRWSNQQLKKNGTIDVQVRDVALVIQLHLLGKDPKQYGFTLLQENPETLYHVYTFGFIEESERDAAHAKWAQESQGN